MLISAPFLSLIFICLNVAMILLYVVVAAATMWFGVPDLYHEFSLGFLGILHLVAAGAFMYYGIQVGK